MFVKDNNGKVEWHNPDFETFGASANAITIKIFGRKETIGDYALQQTRSAQTPPRSGRAPDKLIDEANNELGDSVEKVLFVNQALDAEGEDVGACFSITGT